jgi:hypothetical protein
MTLLLLGTAGLLVMLMSVSVYSAILIAHKTDELMQGRCEDNPIQTGQLFGNA